MLFAIDYKPGAVKKVFCESEENLFFIYAWFAVSTHTELIIENVEEQNKLVVSCFENFGIKTIFAEHTLKLSKTVVDYPATLILNCENNPLLAIPTAVVCAANGIQADLKGLQTLSNVNGVNIISLLQRELYRFNINTDFCDSSKLKIYNNKTIVAKTKPVNVAVSNVLSLHFMLLAILFGKINIELHDDFFESQTRIVALLSEVNLTVEKIKQIP